MSSSSLQLPTTLVNAILGFDFDGQPLWRISQQRSHVKIEITYSLNDADQPTNQPARAVRDSSKPARRRRRRRPRPQRQQPTRPQPTTATQMETTPPPPPPTMTTTVSQPTTAPTKTAIPPAIPPPTKQPVLKPPPGLPEPRRTMTPQRKLLRSSTPRHLLELPPADLNAAIHVPPTPDPKLLSPKVAAKRVGPPSLKKRDWKSRKIDYVEWQLKHDMRWGKVWKYNHPTDHDRYLILECCRAIDKWGDSVKHFMVCNEEDEIYCWFPPPGEENHIPEWWNWLSTFQKELLLPPGERKEHADALHYACKYEGRLYATIPPVTDPRRK